MGKVRKKRISAPENNESKKARNRVNVSSDDESTEDNNMTSEPESDNTDTDTSNKKKNVAKNGGDDDDDESYAAESGEPQTESDSDSDDDVPIVKHSKTSKSKAVARHKRKTSNSKPVVTDEMIKEKELEVEAIISHRRIGLGNYNYRFKWKDAVKGETWESRQTARTYYPNLFWNYDTQAKKADEVEAVLAYKESFGEPKYLLKWKDTARGETWTSRQKTIRLCPDALRKFVADEMKANEIEAILSRKKTHGDIRYLVKWKDHSKGETWETKKTVKKFGRESFNLQHLYIEQQKKAELEKSKDEVEAIVSHRKIRGLKSYLVKWKDHVKGETWVTENRLLGICPQSVSDYDEEVKRAFQKANEVEAIVEHKADHGRSKYLIKWKDHSKGETWETAIRTMAVGQDVLYEFVEKNPDCAPRKRNAYRPRKERKKKRKIRGTQRQSSKTQDRWEDSDTDLESHYIKVKDVVGMSDDDDESDVDDDESDTDESVEWEVERIVGVQKVKGESRKYLIRWKGYGAKHDSWESEEQLNCPDLIKQYADELNADNNLVQTGSRRQSKQSDRRALKRKTSTSRRFKRSGK